METRDRRATPAFLILSMFVLFCVPCIASSVLAEPATTDAVASDPDAVASAADLCGRAFASFRHGPINFEESTTTLRSSAYPVLDRIISLADACRESIVVITGHSDSSGDEAANRKLSLDRARAVADYLTSHGVSGDRLSLAGAGSESPVADNATRYGRSLNRRIEVTFRRGDSNNGS